MAGNTRETPSSARLEELKKAVDEGNAAAVGAFWNEVAIAGTPLVEPSDEPGSTRLTLLWRGADGGADGVGGTDGEADGDGDGVAAVGGPGGMGLDPLEHLAGTDVWYRTYTVPDDTRCAYQFLENHTATPAASPGPGQGTGVAALVELLRRCQPDPLNPKRGRLPSNDDDGQPREDLVFSVVELPGAPPQPWIQERPGVAQGALELHQFDSEMLGNRRRIWVHTPAGYPAGGGGFGLLIVFDGGVAVTEAMSLPTTLDNLYAEGAVPPMVTVFVDNPSPNARRRELPCHEPFADFLAAELVPWVRQRWSFTADPDRTILAGASFGGVAALFAALRHPEHFGNVLSNSGAFWWTRPGERLEWLVRRTAASATVPRRCYLDIGRFETGMAPKGAPTTLSTHRLLRDVLIGKGSEVHYREFSGGHHPLCWRGTFADGLIALTADWEPTTATHAASPHRAYSAE